MIRLIFTEEMRERLRQERIHHSLILPSSCGHPVH
jgi:hypothetical protein